MAKKRKKLTNKEKAFRASIKKEMQKEGLLPPDKPKLNGKKYVEEAIEEWNRKEKKVFWMYYLYKAINIMLGKVDKNGRVSKEAVGAAKVLKLALRLKEFSDRLKEEGRSEYTIKEEIEFIQDILDA
ncbi:MAG: hypothetical protein ACOYA8_03680 [Clostridium sp.]|jgi:hypothetical protein